MLQGVVVVIVVAVVVAVVVLLLLLLMLILILYSCLQQVLCTYSVRTLYQYILIFVLRTLRVLCVSMSPYICTCTIRSERQSQANGKRRATLYTSIPVLRSIQLVRVYGIRST